jgi:hypothetical protein
MATTKTTQPTADELRAMIAQHEEMLRNLEAAEAAKAAAARLATIHTGLDAIQGHVDAAREAIKSGDTPAVRTAVQAVLEAARTITKEVGTTRKSGNATGTRTRHDGPPIATLIKDHLAAHPGEEFTSGQLGKAIDRAEGGGVAAALATMTTKGTVRLVPDSSPRRYTAA